MPISWNEIRHNAISFAREWAGASSESAEKQTFWNEFFAVFGVQRRFVAAFRKSVKNLPGTHDRLDLFWPAILVVEHKSVGEDLDDVRSQSLRSIWGLATAGRYDEIPRYVMLSDFARISLLDLEPEEPIKRTIRGSYRIEFPVGSLHRHIHDFAFMLGKPLLTERIRMHLDTVPSNPGREVQFEWEGRMYFALADVVFVVHPNKSP
jgi:hypothetical protein